MCPEVNSSPMNPSLISMRECVPVATFSCPKSPLQKAVLPMDFTYSNSHESRRTSESQICTFMRKAVLFIIKLCQQYTICILDKMQHQLALTSFFPHYSYGSRPKLRILHICSLTRSGNVRKIVLREELGR